MAKPILDPFDQWKSTHRGVRDQRSAFVAAWEQCEADKLKWIKAYDEASRGYLSPELAEEAARILAD